MAFPRHTLPWDITALSAGRRLSLSLVWVGLSTGVIVRAYRWAILTFVDSPSWGVLLSTLVAGILLLCALVTVHLANFTVRTWKWRAPALGACVALGEAATSLLLIVVGQERLGRATATLADWPSMAAGALVSRVLVVSLYAMVLSAVVILLRKTVDEPV
jgi:hypothetical protein